MLIDNVYNFSIMAIFKNETMNLKVWLDHYLWQGVDHFYMIDNGSTDNPMEILQEYIDKGIVTYHYRDEKYQQVQHYRYIFDYEKLKEKTKWLCICDLDEFFFGINYKLLYVLENDFNNYNIIYTHSFFYGSDGLLEHPKDIRTSIIHRQADLENGIKYIFKPSIINDSSEIWTHWLVYPGTLQKKVFDKETFTDIKFRMNHYLIQSIEYFCKIKMTRGAADVVSNENIRTIDYFINNAKISTIKDDKLKLLIENGYICFDIGANIGNWALHNINNYNYDKIISVEASENTFNKLCKNVESYKNIIPINYAVCDSQEEYIKFYECESDVLSTLKKEWLIHEKSRFNVNLKYEEKFCKTISLDKLIEIYGKPDLIKIDVENAEYDVIKSLTSKTNNLCFEFAREFLDVILNSLNYLHKLGYYQFYIQINNDQYDFRPIEYYDIIQTKSILIKMIPKYDWGMIWCK